MATSFGKYQLIATLGRGGMADVYLALMSGPIGFRKLVVVKRMREDVADPHALETMLLGEAQLAARLQHPNVVQTFEVGLHEGKHYLAMEYLEGQSLASLVRAGGAMSPNLAAQIMADSLAGLSYAHTLTDYDGRPLAIVHRDVSPQNLFVTYGGEVKVVDFGVAKAALASSADTQTGVLKGKLGYMSPEQLQGEDVDGRTDIFASGIVLWEMLTGTRLFRPGPGDGPTQAVAKILFSPIPRPTEIVADVPLPLEAIVMRALERDAARRWPTAAAMREALYSFLEGSSGPPRRDAIGAYVLRFFAEEREAIKKRITSAIAEAESGTSLVPASEIETEQTRAEKSAAGKASSAPPPLSPGTQRLPSIPVGLPSGPTPIAPPVAPPHASAPIPSLPPPPLPAATMPPPPPLPTDPPPSRRRMWPLLVSGAVVTFVATTLLLRQVQKPLPETLEPTAPSAAVATRPAPILVLEGSGTVGVEAAPLFLETFLAKRGGTAIHRERGPRPDDVFVVARKPNGGEESILVRNEGTKDGFACLAARTCDIAMAAREIHDNELTELAAKGLGDPRSPASEHVIGLDGIAVIVNPANPVSALDREKVADIFDGRASDWTQPTQGARAGTIALVAHEDGSGTLDVFDDIILRGQRIAPSARRLPDNAAIATAVAQDPNAIGFVGLGFAKGGAKVLALHDRGIAPMLPSAFTVTTERYLLTRRFYLYTPTPAKQVAIELVEHVLADDGGQQAIKKAGFVDLAVSLKSEEPCEKCPARYAKATRPARRLSVDFRFRGATTQLDARAARDVDRVVKFLREHAISRVLLFGFVDATGDGKADQKRSRELAQAIDGELQTRGIRASVLDGFGGELPIASNATEWGKAKNRRVEIWAIEDR